MAFDLNSIMIGSNLTKQIINYVGLVETVNLKISKLSGSEFEAGIRALEQSKVSVSEQKTLLREARNRFNKAISLEKEERLMLAYIGLAFCHIALGDKLNAKHSLECALKESPSFASLGLDFAKLFGTIGIAFIPFVNDYYEKRLTKHNKCQQKDWIYLQKEIDTFLKSGNLD